MTSPHPTERKAKEETPWYRLPQGELLEKLETSLEGLQDQDIQSRQEKYGPNAISGKAATRWWQLLLEQFQNVLIIVLLIATALSAVLGHAVEAIAIAIIVLFAILLSFVQNLRAEKAIERLRHLAAPEASVRRGGKTLQIPARNLVPGDIIQIQAGDRIPADARLLDAQNLKVEESPLTGESVPSEKNDRPIQESDPALGDQTNMAFAGTNVTYGRALAVVTAIGMETQFGRIAKLLDNIDTSQTPLQKNLDMVGKRLAQAAFVIVTLVAMVGLWRDQPLLDTIVFAIALAVAVVPEALPAVVTISLAIGVQHLIKRNALIRRLPAVETLGATSVICTDKTGTLTKDQMTITQIATVDHRYDVSGTGYAVEGSITLDGQAAESASQIQELLIAGALSSDARLRPASPEKPAGITGDPTEGALIVAAAKAGLDLPTLESRLPRISEIPFSSETKCMTTIHQDQAHQVAFTKGAPEVILQRCGQAFYEEGTRPLSSTERQGVLHQAEQLAAKALRVLAIAKQINDTDDQLTFLGLVGMIDPPRAEVHDSIQVCHTAGIKVVMITGDHPSTAAAIARDLEIHRDGRLIDGPSLAAMTDRELHEQVESIDVYARVSPAQKLRIVTALQQRNHITAMTGDGVNDAPALKKADLGIAMGITGTDVSKEAADMTLTDDNFVSIVGAIEEGRGIYANIRKYLAYLLSANIGEIGLIGAATIVGLPMPLTAVQILYVNLATDGLPALALAVDPPEPNRMKQAPRDSQKGIFTRPLVTLMTIGGLWSTLVNLTVFIGAQQLGYSLPQAMTFTFVTLVLIQFLKAYNFRSIKDSILNRPWANRWLNLAVIWELVLLGIVVHWGVLQAPFGTTDLTVKEWLIAFGLSATIVPVLELTKYWLKRQEP